jgi:hypothetical protein
MNVNLLYHTDVELEGSSSEEESDVELSETLSTTSESNSESSDFDYNDSSTDNERAARNADGETPNLSETQSDSVPQTDDDELASGASCRQEVTVRRNLVKVKKQNKHCGCNFGERNRN